MFVGFGRFDGFGLETITAVSDAAGVVTVGFGAVVERIGVVVVVEKRV